MLRRLKSDVAKTLPPKTETLLYVGMSSVQRDLYRSILMRDVDAVLNTGEYSRMISVSLCVSLISCAPQQVPAQQPPGSPTFSCTCVKPVT